MQPRYAGYLDQQQRDEIRQKVQRMINLLGSPEVAIDDHHSPKLYSRFLQGLLDKLQSSRRLKAKSESPAAHKTELHDARGAALLRQSLSSPASVRDSASPEPAQSVLLESFGGAMTQEPSELMPIDAASEFFAPPLPLNDLPSMNDSSILGVPGEHPSPPRAVVATLTARRLRLDERAPARVPARVLPAPRERALAVHHHHPSKPAQALNCFLAVCLLVSPEVIE